MSRRPPYEPPGGEHLQNIPVPASPLFPDAGDKPETRPPATLEGYGVGLMLRNNWVARITCRDCPSKAMITRQQLMRRPAASLQDVVRAWRCESCGSCADYIEPGRFKAVREFSDTPRRLRPSWADNPGRTR